MQLDISLIKTQLIQGMLSYIEDSEDPSYSTVDVDIVGRLINTFMADVLSLPNPTEVVVMEEVKNFVLTLNDLNELSDYSLIETDQRELLCELIFSIVEHSGIKVKDEDFTEQWREW